MMIELSKQDVNEILDTVNKWDGWQPKAIMHATHEDVKLARRNDSAHAAIKAMLCGMVSLRLAVFTVSNEDDARTVDTKSKALERILEKLFRGVDVSIPAVGAIGFELVEQALFELYVRAHGDKLNDDMVQYGRLTLRFGMPS